MNTDQVMFDKWMNVVPVSFAGITGAAHFRLVDGEWVDPVITRASALIRRFDPTRDFTIMRYEGKWVLVTYD